MSERTSSGAWQRVSSRWLLDHPFLAVVEDVYRLPDGGEITWVRHADEREGRPRPVVAGAICQRDDGRVLLARQWNPGPQRFVEEFPGGGGEPGESPEDCCRRELMEEVGLHARRLEPLGTLVHDVRRRGIDFHIFLATDLEERWLEGDPNEFIEWEWLTPAEIDRGIAEGTYRSAVVLASWMLYRARHPA
jgi:ADP-ribose pyrophosphatase